MLLAITVTAFRKLGDVMPVSIPLHLPTNGGKADGTICNQVAGSCSVAISAACHRPKDDIDAAYLPVSWGEVSPESEDAVGHATFTSLPVQRLTEGHLYAGLRR